MVDIKPAPSTSSKTTDDLAGRYEAVRHFTETLTQPLSPEDCVVQSMPDVSPTRWHLAHTTWFFECFFLRELPNYQVYHPQFHYLFNSYYNTVGKLYPRPRRGLISRPSVEAIRSYRHHVDEAVLRHLREESLSPRLAQVMEIGLNHEQQHQELMLTDIKHVLSCNPLYPCYREALPSDCREPDPLRWTAFPEGIYEIGHDGPGFTFDNETPRHREFLESFRLANRLVTCGEFLEFIEDGGYRQPELWLSLGWQQVQDENWKSPLYWVKSDGQWHIFTLAGLRPLDPSEPVCHVSYFEADAFATWHGSRLPTEAEWEVASGHASRNGNFVDTLLPQERPIHPQACRGDTEPLSQMFGDTWEWTASSYAPYPGYRPLEGALGEYNGKFMCNQYVLRGGSCATSESHIRPTYRNFFPPDAQWQFTGIRLAR